MKFCQPHWEKLREAIKARGLWQLVASSGKEVVDRLKKDGFDPLMAAHNMIVGRTLDVAGLGPMTSRPDGSEWCPLCYLQQNCPCGLPGCAARFEEWIDGASNGAREEAVRLGLVGTAS